MSINNFIPTVWAASIQQGRDRMQIARLIANTQGEGDIKQMGDKVIFKGLVDPTINTYSGSITYEDAVDASVTLFLDQADYFAVTLDDVDAVQAMSGILQAQTSRGGALLGQKADQFLLGLYAEANNTVTDATCDTSTILSKISEAGRLLDEADTPVEGRWMTLAPWVKEKLVLAGVKFSIKEGANVGGGVEWVNHLGFNLFVSNNVTDPTASGTSTKCLAGGKDALVYYDQLVKTKAVVHEDSFGEGVASLHVYGAKVLRPKELVQLILTFAAESTI